MFRHRNALAILPMMVLMVLIVSACTNGPQGGSTTTSSAKTSEETDSRNAAGAPPIDEPTEDISDDTEAEGANPSDEADVEDEGTSPAALVSGIVQLIAEKGGAPVWTGSGSVLDGTNFILTNAHVVDDRYGEYDRLVVSMTDSADLAPVPKYLAEIVAVDYFLDLAVVVITEDLGGNAAGTSFSGLEVGDSDASAIGETLTVLGYPGIGGPTVTLTQGVVSGFLAEEGLGPRAWIKTSASITGGNSGGAAVNDLGELIAVPTLIGDVDCRRIVDSNGDGVIDGDDPCVPVGGNINPMRPINLALPLIEAAQSGTPYESPFDDPINTALADFTDLVFVDADDTSMPGQALAAFPGEIFEVCADFGYSGMVDGMSWGYVWILDGDTVLVDEDPFWNLGSSGFTGLCVTDEAILVAGNYELLLFIDGEVNLGDSVWVGSTATELVFINDSSIDFCDLRMTAPSAKSWGGNELVSVLQSGTQTTLELAEGTYDLTVSDCDGDLVYEEQDVLVDEPLEFALSD